MEKNSSAPNLEKINKNKNENKQKRKKKIWRKFLFMRVLATDGDETKPSNLWKCKKSLIHACLVSWGNSLANPRLGFLFCTLMWGKRGFKPTITPPTQPI